MHERDSRWHFDKWNRIEANVKIKMQSIYFWWQTQRKILELFDKTPTFYCCFSFYLFCFLIAFSYFIKKIWPQFVLRSHHNRQTSLRNHQCWAKKSYFFSRWIQRSDKQISKQHWLCTARIYSYIYYGRIFVCNHKRWPTTMLDNETSFVFIPHKSNFV